MKKILLVDDEPKLLSALQRALGKKFAIEIADGGNAGLKALENAPDYAVVVSDMRMPGMNGVEFLARVKETAPDVVRMMLTGNADQTTAIEAINQGNIFRFLNKPCSPEELGDALNAGLRQHQLLTAERDLLENTLKGSIQVLSEILALADPKSFGNAEVMRDNVRHLAAAMNLKDAWQLEVAALLSPIGFVTIPPELVLKARLGQSLSTEEQILFRGIPAIGGRLLAKIPRLEEVSRILIYQTKSFDGSGLPDDSVAGDSIPLGARILKVLFELAECEAKGRSRSSALEQLRSRSGRYDPQILELISSPTVAAKITLTPPSKPSLTINFAQLRVGHVLSADISTREGILIVVAGNQITSALLERIRNFSTLYGIKDPIFVEG